MQVQVRGSEWLSSCSNQSSLSISLSFSFSLSLSFRVLEQSRPVSQVKTLRIASFLHGELILQSSFNSFNLEFLLISISLFLPLPLSLYLYLSNFSTSNESSVGRPKHTKVMAGALEGDVFIGRRAQELRGLLKIKYPMEHGIVTDWADMERIWNHVYSEELRTLTEEVSLG